MSLPWFPSPIRRPLLTTTLWFVVGWTLSACEEFIQQPAASSAADVVPTIPAAPVAGLVFAYVPAPFAAG